VIRCVNNYNVAKILALFLNYDRDRIECNRRYYLCIILTVYSFTVYVVRQNRA